MSKSNKVALTIKLFSAEGHHREVGLMKGNVFDSSVVFKNEMSGRCLNCIFHNLFGHVCVIIRVQQAEGMGNI